VPPNVVPWYGSGSVGLSVENPLNDSEAETAPVRWR